MKSTENLLAPPIGLFGGTFDPVHNGHLQAALDVAQQLDIGDMRLMPNYLPPHREAPLLNPAKRIEVLEQAVSVTELSLELSEWLAVESGEAQAGYSVESLQRLRARYPSTPLVFVVGYDAYAKIDEWKNYEQLPELCHLVVVSRPGYEAPEGGIAADWLLHKQANEDCNLHSALAGSVQLCDVTAVDVSATVIRKILESGDLPTGLVPDNTLTLLEKHNAA